MKLIGFDFGTTNSLVSQILHNRVVNALDEENKPTPSLVCYEHDSVICGQEAKKKLSGSGLGIQGNIVRSPKRLLKNRSNVNIGGIQKHPVEIIADSIQFTLNSARTGTRQLDLEDIDGAVVTIPVTMLGYERDALRRAFLKENIQIYQFIYEPFSALYAFFRSNPQTIEEYHNQTLLVVDWGGGTLDVTLCKINNNYLYQLANAGLDDVGGDEIDSLIMKYIVDKAIRERGLKNHTLEPGAISRLLEQCESAKIDLSSRNKVKIYVDSFFSGLEDNSLACTLTKEELENISKSTFEKGFDIINNLLYDYRLEPEQISLCLFIGGMSHVSYIESRIHEIFGPLRTVSPKNRSTLVAEGAAWFAFDQNTLFLAKNIEIELARGSFFPILKHGLKLPFGGECTKKMSLKLYSCDPRDGVAKIMLYSPKMPGDSLPSDSRVFMDALSILIDEKAKAYFESLNLDYIIDENLIIKLHAISSHIEDENSIEIHNLEFGILLPSTQRHNDNKYTEKKITTHPEEHKFKDSIRLKSNIILDKDRGNDFFIPGDLLYLYHPEYFDVRWNLPQIQRDEYLYFNSKCIICGRKINDPLCTCKI